MPAGGDAGPAGAWGDPHHARGGGKTPRRAVEGKTQVAEQDKELDTDYIQKKRGVLNISRRYQKRWACCYRRKCTNQTCKSTVKVRKLFQSTVPFFIKAFFFLNKENN